MNENKNYCENASLTCFLFLVLKKFLGWLTVRDADAVLCREEGKEGKEKKTFEAGQREHPKIHLNPPHLKYFNEINLQKVG